MTARFGVVCPSHTSLPWITSSIKNLKGVIQQRSWVLPSSKQIAWSIVCALLKKSVQLYNRHVKSGLTVLMIYMIWWGKLVKEVLVKFLRSGGSKIKSCLHSSLQCIEMKQSDKQSSMSAVWWNFWILISWSNVLMYMISIIACGSFLS